MFYVIDGEIVFTVRSEDDDRHSGSGSHQFYDTYGIFGYHVFGEESFLNKLYVNTWNHMMGTTYTNPSMHKVTNTVN